MLGKELGWGGYSRNAEQVWLAQGWVRGHGRVGGRGLVHRVPGYSAWREAMAPITKPPLHQGPPPLGHA